MTGFFTDEESRCRFCGNPVTDSHHIVWRSVLRSDDPRNLIPACRPCHIAIHDKAFDPLPYLTLEEQAYATSLIGIERAHRLLAPSVYRNADSPVGSSFGAW